MIIDDEIDILHLLERYFKLNGYSVITAEGAEEALNKLCQQPDLILLDINMPGMDGISFCKSIRDYVTCPILFLTANTNDKDKVKGFSVGGDDYIVKPFDTDVLKMKLGALLRRAKIQTEKQITIGNFTMNAEERIALVNGEEIPLTVREFDLLFKLLSYPKKTFTRSALMDEFWDYDSSATSRTVDVYMAKIREKTADCDGFEILTVHGLGYKAVLK